MTYFSPFRIFCAVMKGSITGFGRRKTVLSVSESKAPVLSTCSCNLIAFSGREGDRPWRKWTATLSLCFERISRHLGELPFDTFHQADQPLGWTLNNTLLMREPNPSGFFWLIECNAGGALESKVTAADVPANLAALKKASSLHHRRFAISSACHHASYQAVVNDHALNGVGKVLAYS